ncbi:MAG TPA: hypothetical protein VHW02_07695 [Rhizomicrobium sp.]|jgi:hypothetical protein|nr:hypothetical protein [Rhizomicrobium sp.]
MAIKTMTDLQRRALDYLQRIEGLVPSHSLPAPVSANTLHHLAQRGLVTLTVGITAAGISALEEQI